MVGKLHRVLLILALLLLNSACVYIRSRAGVVGTYHLGSNHHGIVLEMFPDGSFTETISYGKGEVTKHVGRWDFKPANPDVTFESLWIPKEFAPDSFVGADESSQGGPKFTAPGSWTLTPTYEWGTVTLDVFPDEDVSFRKPTWSKFLFVLIALLGGRLWGIAVFRSPLLGETTQQTSHKCRYPTERARRFL